MDIILDTIVLEDEGGDPVPNPSTFPYLTLLLWPHLFSLSSASLLAVPVLQIYQAGSHLRTLALAILST